MRNKVLVVEDVEINREVLAGILESEYTVLTAENGRQAIEMINDHQKELAVILLDLIMPEMDGFAVLKVMSSRKWIEKIPVLVISSEDSARVEKECFEYGVSDFIRKPFDNAIVRKRVGNVVKLFGYQNELKDTIAKQTDTLRKQYKILKVQADVLRERNRNIIDILGTVVEHRNLENSEHVKRVKSYTGILARQLKKEYPECGLTDEKIEVIVSASALHDIGKISIPDNILFKPGKLTQEELTYMKSHTTRGCEILSGIKGVWDEEYSQVAHDICRYHHERYDGRGYPDGLVGDAIPLAAQIVSVANTYDVLTNERVDKAAYSKDQAFQMIINGECGMFSPKLLEAFRNVRKEFEGMSLDGDQGKEKQKEAGNEKGKKKA